MAKQKIALFGIKYFPSKGGTSRVVENLLLELNKHFDITLYCYKHPKAANYISGVKTIQFSEIPIKGLGVFIYYLVCCIHLLVKGKYDLVHVHKTDGAFFLPLLKLKYKLVVTSHALPYMNEKWSWLGKSYFRRVERMYMESDSTRTAVSKTQTAYYSQKYNRPVRYIPNGIYPVSKIHPELADNILQEKGIKPGYIFFAARRVIPLKGCHYLIEALKLINYKGTLVIAGDMKQLPAYSEKLLNAAEGLDVHFLGYISNRDTLNALIHQASLFVFPSEIEGMSMMLLEVGSVGTPMLCSDIDPNKSVLTSNEVLFFQSENVGDLVKQLQWSFNNSEEMQQRASRAKQKIEKEYSIHAVAQQYINLYQEVIKQ